VQKYHTFIKGANSGKFYFAHQMNYLNFAPQKQLSSKTLAHNIFFTSKPPFLTSRMTLHVAEQLLFTPNF
jgi:hypothetical protein